MASKIKVDQILGSTGSTITVPTGQTFTITDGLAVASLPTVTVAKGGTNLTSLTAGDVLYATGSTTLAKLAKGSDDDVLTLASGLPSWAAAAGGGKVLQVIGAMTAPDTFNSTSASFVDTGYYIDIVPSLSSSKILIQFDIQVNTQTASAQLFLDIYRSINSATAASLSGFTNGFGFLLGRDDVWTRQTYQYLDSPSTALTTRYLLYMKTNGQDCYIGYGTTSNMVNAGATFTATELDYA